MLKLDAVGRQFGSLWAVRDVSFTVEPSEIVGIIGPNGAGKSTLFNLIAGAVVPTTGAIRFLDRAIDYGKPYQLARGGLARTFQIPKPFKQLSVREKRDAQCFTASPYASSGKLRGDGHKGIHPDQ